MKCYLCDIKQIFECGNNLNILSRRNLTSISKISYNTVDAIKYKDILKDKIEENYRFNIQN